MTEPDLPEPVVEVTITVWREHPGALYEANVRTGGDHLAVVTGGTLPDVLRAAGSAAARGLA